MKRILFKKLADNTEPQSMASEMRRKRLALFNELMSTVRRPIKVLDVGGTRAFWEAAGFAHADDIEFTILNIYQDEIDYPNFTSIVGDATDMHDFADHEFDVVFSNSVIEHVGGGEKQRSMAQEIRRVGKRYFVQTPNKYFPIEPHFIFPLFQFLPMSIRISLLRHLDLGWIKRTPDKTEAEKMVSSIKLLSEDEFRKLFPDATLQKEKLFGMTKSFMAYGGW